MMLRLSVRAVVGIANATGPRTVPAMPTTQTHNTPTPTPTFEGRPLAGRTVGVDIDGVLYQFVPSLRRHALRSGLRGVNELPDPHEWDFAKQWNMTSEQLVALMHDAVDNGELLSDLVPYPGSASGLSLLRHAGAQVRLVTDRAWLGRSPAVVQARTFGWLQRNHLEYDNLTFAADKRSVPCDFFIEDRPKNVQDLIGAGVDTFVRDHPYNRHVTVAPTRRVPDVWSFAVQVITEAAA